METLDTTSKTKNIMSRTTEVEIITSLERFEQNLGFLEPSLTISDLAQKLNTSIKYLSFILNKHYLKDFNTYINELRIHYIVNKIESNKEYRSYKISYLAKECGFSSHSKFSAIFKSVKGFSPSFFIEINERNISM